MEQFHKVVCEQENYICSVCQEDFSYPIYFLEDGRNAYVCGDHLKTQKAYPELKFETDNGRCICLPCHNKRHSKGLKSTL